MTIKKYPGDWRDLQNKVGEILLECNFSVEIEKKVESIRSDIEIDVFAHEIVDDRKYTIVCECKYWKSNIPQLYVHALRSVVNDTGVNKAYIITTSNFQVGANYSSEYTNIELKNWEQFQKIFFKSWYSNFFSRKLTEITYRDYDPNAIRFFESFELIGKAKFISLIDMYYFIEKISNHFPDPIFKNFPERFLDIENKLPLKEKLNKDILEELEWSGHIIPENILSETNYSEFLILLEAFVKPIYDELDKLNLVSNDD